MFILHTYITLIQYTQNQFQEKLAELAPLPEILKQSQTKLQETQQIRLIAERNCEDLSRELQGYKDKLQIQQNEVEVLRAQYQTLLVVTCYLNSVSSIGKMVHYYESLYRAKGDKEPVDSKRSKKSVANCVTKTRE